MYVGTEGQECTTGHVNPVESTSPLTAGKPLKAPGRPLEWTSNAPPALHKAWIRHQISGCHRGAVCLDKAMPAQKWGGGGCCMCGGCGVRSDRNGGTSHSVRGALSEPRVWPTCRAHVDCQSGQGPSRSRPSHRPGEGSGCVRNTVPNLGPLPPAPLFEE